MSVFEYIILSFALAVPTMVTVRGCALKNPIRLTRGLGVSFLLALEHTALLLLGIGIGNMLRFGVSEYDNLIYQAKTVSESMFQCTFRAWYPDGREAFTVKTKTKKMLEIYILEN